MSSLADIRREAQSCLDGFTSLRNEREISDAVASLRRCRYFAEHPRDGGSLLIERLRGASTDTMPAELWFFAALLFLRAGDLAQSRSLLEEAFACDLEGVNPTEMAEGQLTLGLLEARCNNWERAVVAWEESVKLLPPHSPHEVHVRKLLGQGWETLGAGDRAMANLQEALKIAARSDTIELECELLGLLGDHCRARDLADQSASYYLTCIERARDVGYRPGEAAAHLGYGDLCLDLCESDEAARALKAGLEAARDTGDRLLQIVALARLSELSRRGRDSKRALAHVEEAIFIASGEDSAVALGSLHHQLGLVHETAGKPQLARTAYEKAAEERRRADDSGGLGATLVNLGALHHEAGDIDDARRCYREAIVAFNDSGVDRREIAVVVEDLKRLEEHPVALSAKSRDDGAESEEVDDAKRREA